MIRPALRPPAVACQRVLAGSGLPDFDVLVGTVSVRPAAQGRAVALRCVTSEALVHYRAGTGPPGKTDAWHEVDAAPTQGVSSRGRSAGRRSGAGIPLPAVRPTIAERGVPQLGTVGVRAAVPWHASSFGMHPVSSSSNDRGVVDPSAVRLRISRTSALRRSPVRRRRRVPLPFRPRHVVGSARSAHRMCDVVLLTHWDSVSCMVRFARCGLR